MKKWGFGSRALLNLECQEDTVWVELALQLVHPAALHDVPRPHLVKMDQQDVEIKRGQVPHHLGQRRGLLQGLWGPYPQVEGWLVWSC